MALGSNSYTQLTSLVQLQRVPTRLSQTKFSEAVYTTTAAGVNGNAFYRCNNNRPSHVASLRQRHARSSIRKIGAIGATTPVIASAGEEDEEAEEITDNLSKKNTSPPFPSAAPPTETSKSNKGHIVALVAAISAVMFFGICNRLLYKMALKPLGDYVFFLAQLQTFGYCFVYFGTLAVRYKAGLVSNEMLQVPRKMAGTFVAIGFVEAMSSLLSFISASQLPGVVLPLLGQTVLFWQVLFAITILRKRLGLSQIIGVTLVVSGVGLAAWPSTATAAAPNILDHVNPIYALIFAVSMAFPAIDTILKENVFRQWREKWSSGKSGRADLDVFILNSFGSVAQAAFIFALLPAITAVRGMAIPDLPSYLSAGWQCVRGITPPCGADCTGAPLIPILYVVFNLAFNVAVLQVIKQAGNVAMSLTMSAIVPATLFAFTLPLPYLDPAPPLGPNFLLGATVLMLGLGAYNAPMWAPAFRKYLDGMREKSRTEWGST